MAEITEMPELTIEAKELRRLVLGAVEDLGRYGLEITSDSMAAVSSLIVNASRLGRQVDADRIDSQAREIADKEASLKTVSDCAIKWRNERNDLRSRIESAERADVRTFNALLHRYAMAVLTSRGVDEIQKVLSDMVTSVYSRLEIAERENERLRIENKRWVPRIEIGGASAGVQTIQSPPVSSKGGSSNG